MPIVSEKKFLEEEEKTVLLEIRQKTQALIAELGEIELIKLQLEDRHDSAKIFLNDLQIKVVFLKNISFKLFLKNIFFL